MSSKVLYSIAGGLFLIVLIIFGFIFKDSIGSIGGQQDKVVAEQTVATNDPAAMDETEYACRVVVDQAVHDYNQSELERVSASGEKPKLKMNIYDDSVDCPNGDINRVYQFSSGTYTKSSYLGDENSYFTLGDDATYANIVVNGESYEVKSGEQVKVQLNEGDEITIESDGSVVYFGEYIIPPHIDPTTGTEIITSDGAKVVITE